MFIRDPWSRIWDFFHPGSRILNSTDPNPQSRVQKSTRSPPRIRNTESQLLNWSVVSKLLLKILLLLPRSTFSLSDKMYSGEEGGSFKRMRFSEDSETTQRRKVSSNEVLECRPLFGFCVFFFGELFFLAFCPFSNYLPVLLKQDLEIFVLYSYA